MFVIFLSIAGLLLALKPPATILQIATQTFTGLAVLFPTVLFGLYLKRVYSAAAILSILAGESVMLLFYFKIWAGGGCLTCGMGHAGDICRLYRRPYRANAAGRASDSVCTQYGYPIATCIYSWEFLSWEWISGPGAVPRRCFWGFRPGFSILCCCRHFRRREWCYCSAHLLRCLMKKDERPTSNIERPMLNEKNIEELVDKRLYNWLTL